MMSVSAERPSTLKRKQPVAQEIWSRNASRCTLYHMTTSRLLVGLAGALLFSPVLAYSEEPVDLAMVHRIKAEAFENSKVMDHEFYLTDVYGPRLAGSPNYQAAGDWVMKRLKEYGLTNVHEETWAFGRGWTYSKFAGHMIEPQYQPLIGFPLAWTPGTEGAVQGQAIYAPMTTDADLDKFKGKLKGKIVLTMRTKDLAMVMQPQGHRLTDEELASRTQVADPSRLAFPFRPTAGVPTTPEEREKAAQFRKKLNQFLKDEGALVVL